MSKGIFLINEEGGLVRLNQAEYDSESVLQEMLAKYPELIPGEQINSGSPRRWLLIDREIGIPDEDAGSKRWSLDHLLIDQDAIEGISGSSELEQLKKQTLQSIHWGYI